MNNMIDSNPPIIANSGIVIRKVSKMILKLLADLTNLRILIILNDLKTDIAVPTLVNRFIYSKIAPAPVRITTMKSKILKDS